MNFELAFYSLDHRLIALPMVTLLSAACDVRIELTKTVDDRDAWRDAKEKSETGMSAEEDLSEKKPSARERWRKNMLLSC